MADCDVGGSIGEAFVDPQHDVPLPRPAPHPQQRQPGGGPPSAPASGARLLWVGGVRVLSCPAVAVRRAAAQPAPHAGGGLDHSSTVFNLDSRGRAASILRPMTACLPPGALAGVQQAVAVAGGAC